MWKQFAEWLGALLVTAAVAVAIFGAAEWVEQRSEAAVAATADGLTVVVDAGHGGTDGGAVGSDTGVQEAGLNLTVALRLSELLRERGANVVLTRTGEEALADSKQADMAARRKVCNTPNADIVVSIHMNKFTDRSISGAMAYYMAGSAEGQRLAQSVIDSVCHAINRARRLANPGDYFIIRECACPAVLVECGFLSNSDDERLLTDPAHQEALARAVADGVMAYWGAKGS